MISRTRNLRPRLPAGRNLILSTLVLISASCAQVHSGLDETPTSSDKIPFKLQQSLHAGVARDVLVELTPENALPAADGSDPNVGGMTEMLVRDVNALPTSEAQALVDEEVEARAGYYHAAQQTVIDAVDPTEVSITTRYEHVPFLFVRVQNLHGLYALANRPEVLRLHEERFLDRELAESLPLIKQPPVAAAGKIGTGTAVAVLDTGCDFSRTDFGSCSDAGSGNCKVAFAKDFAAEDNQRDDNGHGTNVSAIVLGVAPGTKVLALDVFAGSTAPSSAILSAIDWSIKNRTTYNIVAMNLSLGAGSYNAVCSNDLFATALANARAAGIVPAVASGNNGYTGAIASPACTPAAVSVGAVYDSNVGGLGFSVCSDPTTAADKIACFSNSASFLSILAPGAFITAGGYKMTGTSQATPHVAGALAVVRAAFPQEPINTSIARLTSTGPSITDPRNNVSKHRLDLQAAMNGAVTVDSTPPTGSVVINGNAAATGSTSVMLTLTGEDANGVTGMCVSNAATCTTFEPFANTKAWTLTTGDGDKTVRVALKDAAGNQTVVVDTIRLDTAAPSGGVLRAVAKNGGVSLTWTAATDPSGVPSYRVMFAPNAAPSCSTGTMVYSGGALAYEHNDLSNGTVYAYRLCPIDGAGNVGAGSTASARPAPEFTAPTGYVLINGGAGYVKSSNVTLTLSATDASGVSGMCISNTGTCTSWEPYATSKAWSLGNSNGPATVSVWFKDKYENASGAPTKASITVDTTAPSGGSLTAVQGAVNSKQIVLNWTAATDVYGVASYRLVFAPGTNAPASCSAGAMLMDNGGLTYVHTGLNVGSAYSYRLCAIDRAGNASPGLTRTINAR